MKRILARRVGSAGLAAVLVVASLALARPASAVPAGAWYYDYFQLAEANKISTGAGVTVAVIDTGVQASLTDLAGQVLPGKAFAGGGDPRVDIGDPKGRYYGHGTAMAGFVAATGKGDGYRGVAPGAKILPIGVASSDARVDLDAATQAIPWAVDHGATILNLSLGASGACPAAMQRAVDYATSRDVIVVASVGNTAGATIGAPANCIGVIGMGVLAKSSTFGAWSGQTSGPDVDFIAPGQNLPTLLLDNTISNPDGTGSSESSAIASGAFALLRSKFPQDSARQIVTRAMYTLQTKAGRANYGKRINDQIGYGSLQPQFALTVNPPGGAKNPIYDQLEAHLKAGANSASPSAPAPGSGAAPSSAPAAGARDSGGISGGVVALIGALVVALVVVVLVVVLIARSRRRATPGGYPPGGYGPPPRGYGPPPGGGPIS